MSKDARLKTLTTARGDKFVFKRLGYHWELDWEKCTIVPASKTSRPLSTEGSLFLSILDSQESVAKLILREHRIFDWGKWVGKSSELEPVAAAAIDLLDNTRTLRAVMGSDDETKIASAGLDVGVAVERMSAQFAWAKRNPLPQTKEAKTAKVTARRASLAEYIREQERPEKRPGAWYEGFREAYPDHKATDKTLKADYPHALALSRKRAKPG